MRGMLGWRGYHRLARFPCFSLAAEKIVCSPGDEGDYDDDHKGSEQGIWNGK